MENEQADTMPQWASALLNQVNYLSNLVADMQDHSKEEAATPPSSAAKETTTEAQIAGKPTKHLGPLATYDGDREGLESWISQAQAKLHVDYADCSETTKFFMIHNQLRGEASRQLQPWVQAVTHTQNMTAQGLISQLRLSFGDPHSKEKAQRKLHKLKQANRSFMEYFTEYRKLLLEAGGSDWPDEIRKSYLEAGLSLELQRCMIGKNAGNESFEDYCNELKQASDQLEAFNLRNKGIWRSNHTIQRGTTPGKQGIMTLPQEAGADRMDWEPSKPLRTLRAAIETNGRRATWVSPETLAYRREKSLCLRCGNQNHIVRDCRFLPARRPLATNKALTSNPTGINTALALPEADDHEEESEKE